MTRQPDTIPFAGENERKLELELGPVAPWKTTIRVHSIRTNHGRQTSLPHDYLFEVTADWTGPPAIGFPPSARPVSARDCYVVTSLQDATKLARRALDAFAKGGDEAPDLRALATTK